MKEGGNNGRDELRRIEIKECGHMRGGGVFVFCVEVWKSWKEEGTKGDGIKFSFAKVVRRCRMR